MGGEASHEYHVQSDVGQDTVHYCFPCTSGINSELLSQEDSQRDQVCTTCNTAMTRLRCMEIAHTFLLGTKYSQVFDASVVQDGMGTCVLFVY
jgi:prolyl-tRNA synthetase